jgi:hypothetical protein
VNSVLVELAYNLDLYLSASSIRKQNMHWIEAGTQLNKKQEIDFL